MRNRIHDFQTSTLLQISEDAIELWKIWHNRKYPTALFLLLCLNLIVAPVVQAATGSEVLSRPQAYALGVLGLATIALSVYLFMAMFQPERF